MEAYAKGTPCLQPPSRCQRHYYAKHCSNACRMLGHSCTPTTPWFELRAAQPTCRLQNWNSSGSCMSMENAQHRDSMYPSARQYCKGTGALCQSRMWQESQQNRTSGIWDGTWEIWHHMSNTRRRSASLKIRHSSWAAAEAARAIQVRACHPAHPTHGGLRQGASRIEVACPAQHTD